MEEAYDRAPAEYNDGTRRFEFSGALYGHSSVRRALADALQNKCSFCESLVGDHGDVEHFRPKAAVCQGPGQSSEGPGYYWLAYEWNNLLLACTICNQRYKRNFFPLADVRDRARSHHQNIVAEDPLLIDPAAEDPEEHISFRSEVAFAIDGNRRGEATIVTVGLNRKDLVESRRDRLKLLQALALLARVNPGADAEQLQIAGDAEAALNDLTADKEEFAGMSRAAAANGYWLR